MSPAVIHYLTHDLPLELVKGMAVYIPLHGLVWVYAQITRPLHTIFANHHHNRIYQHVRAGHRFPYRHCKNCSIKKSREQELAAMSAQVWYLP